MNRDEIKKVLPHREPMLLVDQVELVDGKSQGKYQVRGDEFFLQGHFPGNPVVPGVIQCEMLAQSACVLLIGQAEGMTPLFTGLQNVKFRGQVKPGDVFESQCELVRSRGQFYFAKGTGRVNGKVCVSAEFSFALVKVDAE
ncbi:3-hydroxyacyl-ACP dehydratase FabZ [Acutalibacter intestini]|uniref:3-hydroxyacyl-ACP dehydratase FabZ n=1 Tax=Acutalibacter intestini TaxID=3093659 RepID=UPI002170AE4B|nr:3-hydroxyacyl-ACP dehydratase FabZ [Acutalibacter sp. M00204]MCI9553076.1 3-hydroxyacyl-ACP dehydratase FabZ [Acutalibacter sp.]